jgi:hypothetical protein
MSNKETLEEAAEKHCLINNIPTDQMIVKNDRSCEFETPVTMFIQGAKWQAERMYREEEVEKITKELFFTMANCDKRIIHKESDFNKWLVEQFKKK